MISINGLINKMIMSLELKDKIIVVNDHDSCLFEGTLEDFGDYFLKNDINKQEISEWANRNGLTIEYRDINFYIKELNKTEKALSIATNRIEELTTSINRIYDEGDDDDNDY